MSHPTTPAPIGVFDSGYGGLTILSEICRQLPQYDYIYLGDNARSPYGTRSFDVINDFTLQAVKYLFDAGCPLVILACNTASAKALREIQQHYLPDSEDPTRRVLGVIRPTVEAISRFTKSRHVGVVATPGTVSSHSYATEIGKLFPEVTVEEQACPMWVPPRRVRREQCAWCRLLRREVHQRTHAARPEDRYDHLRLHALPAPSSED